jgi:acetyltransferase-like isoleucine patch superfamily enzyme
MIIYDYRLFEITKNNTLTRLFKNKIFSSFFTIIEVLTIFILNLPIPVYSSIVKILVTSIPGLPSKYGCFLRTCYYKPRIKRMGKNVVIEQGALLLNLKDMELDDFSYIDKYVIIASNKTKIGKRVHIAPYSFITGGGDFEIEDYAGISNHVSIITSTETLKPGTRSSGPMVPDSQRDVIRGYVIIKKDAFIGTKATILTNVTINEGSVIGAGSVITKDTDPWTIYVPEGVKGKKFRKRPELKLEDI